jgi:hypothetical protein
MATDGEKQMAVDIRSRRDAVVDATDRRAHQSDCAVISCVKGSSVRPGLGLPLCPRGINARARPLLLAKAAAVKA